MRHMIGYTYGKQLEHLYNLMTLGISTLDNRMRSMPGLNNGEQVDHEYNHVGVDSPYHVCTNMIVRRGNVWVIRLRSIRKGEQ